MIPIPQQKPQNPNYEDMGQSGNTSSIISSIGSAAGFAFGGPIGATIGNVVGSLFGSKKKRGPSFEDRLTMQTRWDDVNIKNRMQATMAAAKKHGIHPLVALGATPTGGNISTHNGGGEVQSSLGQNLGRAAASLFQARQQKQLEELALERAHLENDLLRSQITNINKQPSNPPNVVTTPSTEKQAYENVSTPVGYAEGTKPMYQIGIDPETKEPFRVYNEDLGDNEVLQAITAFGVTIPDIIHGRITKPMASKLRKLIKTKRKKRERPKSYKYGDKY